MYISKLKIKNFKCFDEVEINFDPNFNLIIGENNSGKSTIFESLRLWQLAFNKFLKDRTNNKSDSSFYSRDNYSFTIDELNFLRIDNFKNLFFKTGKTIEISLTIKNIKGNFAELPIYFTLNTEEQNLRFNLCSNKTSKTKVSGYLLDVIERTKGSTFKDMLLMTYINPIFHLPIKEPKYQKGYILEKLHQAKASEVIRNLIEDYAPIDYQTAKNKSKKVGSKELIDIEKTLHEIIKNEDLLEGEKPILTFTSNLKPDEDVNINLFATNNQTNTKVEVSQLGSGTINIINILAVLAYGDYERFLLTVLLLDEPDSHLHANNQQRLYKDLIEKSKAENKQIFVITHNHELIDCAENVLFIDHTRIEKYKIIDLISKDEYYTVYKKIALEYHLKMIEIEEKKEIENQLKEITKPTLYCEGSTDVTIIKTAFSKLYNVDSFFDNKIDMIDGNSESGVALYIKSNLKRDIFVIGLLDNDKAGQGQIKSLIKNIAKPYSIKKIIEDFHYQKYYNEEKFNTHLLLLPIPQFRIDEADFFNKNLFIEYMFSNETLKTKLKVDMYTEKGTTYEKIQLGEDGKILGTEKSKVTKNITELDKDDFLYFIPLFQKIAELIAFELPILND